jgi:hypothetical protein
MGNSEATVEGMNVKEQDKLKDKAYNPEVEQDKASNPKEKQLNKLDAAVELNVKEQEKVQDKVTILRRNLMQHWTYYSQLFKPVPGQQVPSVPAKVVLDGKRKENELQSETFYSHGLESGKAASVQEKHKMLMFLIIMKKKNKKKNVV